MVNWTCELLSDLLQRLRTRERERQRLHQRSHSASREGRKSLSYDAPPFYMTPPPATSGGSSSDNLAASESSDPATSADMIAGSSGTDMAQRRQLGERLYPKVQSIQPVSFHLLIWIMIVVRNSGRSGDSRCDHPPSDISSSDISFGRSCAL